jgi:predicted nucleic acid-binding protein
LPDQGGPNIDGSRSKYSRRASLADHQASASSEADEADEADAIALIRAHGDKSYSLCDALTFVVCERSGIAQAISCDDDFRSYGRLTVLL